MARTTQQVFEHHVAALVSGDMDELMADYADDAVLLTLEGSFAGKGAIQAFFEGMLQSLSNFVPTGSEIAVEGDTLLLQWAADTDTVSIPQGVDTFIIRDDKIQRHTGWSVIVPKEG